MFFFGREMILFCAYKMIIYYDLLEMQHKKREERERKKDRESFMVIE
jgi:hypothetical protein